MNKVQKIAYKLAKHDEKIGKTEGRNKAREKCNIKVNPIPKLKILTTKNVQNEILNFFKREKMSMDQIVRHKELIYMSYEVWVEHKNNKSSM